MKLEEIGFYSLTDDRCKNASFISDLKRCEIILNNICNYDCVYCRDKKGDYEMSIQKAYKIIDFFAVNNLENVRFSGGEPTLYKDLTKLVKYAKTNGIKRIALSTNGTAKKSVYNELIKSGCNDFSISLDACCSNIADSISNSNSQFEKVVENIKYISKLTYATIGIVLNEKNINDAEKIILFCDSLGVSDIRIIPAAQESKKLDSIKLSKTLLSKYPILKYRIDNMNKGFSVRGLIEKDNTKCPLILDDMVIRDNYHYPCVIKMREGCKPVGELNDNIRQDRLAYYCNTNVYDDKICKNNCLDVCRDYNNKYKEFHTKRGVE